MSASWWRTKKETLKSTTLSPEAPRQEAKKSRKVLSVVTGAHLIKLDEYKLLYSGQLILFDRFQCK